MEGAAPPHDRDDDLEYWTEKINGMGSGDSIDVPKVYSGLRIYKGWVDWVSGWI